MSYLIGLDIGTSKICALVFDTRKNKALFVLSRENSSFVKIKKEFSEQNPKKIKNIVFTLLEIIRKKFNNISAIGITGQMHGGLIVDRKLQPLTNLITWQDKRAKGMIPEIIRKVGEDRFYDCGCLIQSGYMGATLYWLKKYKMIPENAYKVCCIHDWIAAQLMRKKNLYTDPTDAASSGLFNVRKREWNHEVIERLNIEESLLLELKNSGEVIGFTEDEIPVCCAFGDNQASVYASFHRYEGEKAVNLNMGTGSQISLIIKKFKSYKLPFEIRPYMDGGYLMVGASLNGGIVYSLLKDFFVSLGMNFWGVKEKNVFNKMNLLALKAPQGCDGLICNPYFFGERGQGKLKASFVGITHYNFTPSHICRAVLEGMVRVLHNFYVKMGEKKEYIVETGNAIKENKLLQEIVIKTFKMDLKLSSCSEEAAYGAASLAGKQRKR